MTTFDRTTLVAFRVNFVSLNVPARIRSQLIRYGHALPRFILVHRMQEETKEGRTKKSEQILPYIFTSLTTMLFESGLLTTAD